jgi:hypothetical protein
MIWWKGFSALLFLTAAILQIIVVCKDRTYVNIVTLTAYLLLGIGAAIPARQTSEVLSLIISSMGGVGLWYSVFLRFRQRRAAEGQ